MELNRRAFLASIAAAPLFARGFQRPLPPTIDPDKEARAHQLAMKAGLMSRNDVELAAHSVFEELSLSYSGFEALEPGLTVLFIHGSGRGDLYQVKSVEAERITLGRLVCNQHTYEGCLAHGIEQLPSARTPSGSILSRKA